MASNSDRHAMIDACIAAGEHVNRCGSLKLRAVMRVLLYLLAQEMIGQGIDLS